MEKFEFDITVPATDKAEALKKMTALVTLASELSEKEITKLAHVVKHNPAQKAVAKKFLGL